MTKMPFFVVLSKFNLNIIFFSKVPCHSLFVKRVKEVAL